MAGAPVGSRVPPMIALEKGTRNKARVTIRSIESKDMGGS